MRVNRSGGPFTNYRPSRLSSSSDDELKQRSLHCRPTMLSCLRTTRSRGPFVNDQRRFCSPWTASQSQGVMEVESSDAFVVSGRRIKAEDSSSVTFQFHRYRRLQGVNRRTMIERPLSSNSTLSKLQGSYIRLSGLSSISNLRTYSFPNQRGHTLGIRIQRASSRCES